MMKIAFMFVAVLIASAPVAMAESNGKVVVHVDGLRNNNGSVRIALFNSQDNYDKDKFTGDLSYKKAIVSIKDNKAEYAFEGLPYGEYAIKLFHDETGSGKFETGMFGIPKVEYGFSNNAHGKFGPAGYDKAKFALNKLELIQDIHMQTP